MAFLNAVSCPTTAPCIAVGNYDTSSGSTRGLLLTRSGGARTSAKAPVPAGSATPAGELVDGVSCPTASFCAADGNYTDASAVQKGVFLTR